jgi:hypothetical protein
VSRIKWLQVIYLLKEQGIFIDRAGKFIEGAGNGDVALLAGTALIGGQLVIERAAVREREGRAVAMTVKEMPVD